MNDLISRQALCEYALNQKDKSVTPNDIMRFPSAQPDTGAIWDALSKVYNTDNVPDEAKSIIGDVMLGLPSAQPDTDEEIQKMQDMEQAQLDKAFKLGREDAKAEIVRCKDCKYSEHWYRDKSRCFLWHEEGIDVFEDGFCNYAERRTDG